MGRYIICKVRSKRKRRPKYEYETVWKYVLATQDSEMHRIYDELGIGQYYLRRWLMAEGKYEVVSSAGNGVEDVLILNREDIKSLEEQILVLKAKGERSYYVDMLEAICNFAHRYSDQAEFILEGDL